MYCKEQIQCNASRMRGQLDVNVSLVSGAVSSFELEFPCASHLRGLKVQVIMELSAYSLGLRKARMEHIAAITNAALLEMDRFTQVRKQCLEQFEADFRHGLKEGRRAARIDYPIRDGARVCKDSAFNDNAIIFTAPMEIALDRMMDADGIGSQSAKVVHETDSDDPASPSSGGACTSTCPAQRLNEIADTVDTVHPKCEIVCGKPSRRIRCKSSPVFR